MSHAYVVSGFYYNDNYFLPQNLAPGEENPWGTPTSLSGHPSLA